MRISTSQVDKFRECSEAWHYAYIEKLEPTARVKKWEKGSFVHELMHVMYQTLKANPALKPGGPEIENIMRSRIMNTEVTSENIELMSVVLPLMLRYIKEQSRDIDTGHEILGVELELFQEWNGIILHGFIDLVYKDSR